MKTQKQEKRRMKEKLDCAEFLLGLADETRLRILNLLKDGEEVCVTFMIEVLKESQPKISRHLAHLKNLGLILGRRDGKWIHYKLTQPTNPYAAVILANLLEWLKIQEKMQKDYEKLLSLFNNRKSSLLESNTFTKIDTKQFPRKESAQKARKREEIEIFLL